MSTDIIDSREIGTVDGWDITAHLEWDADTTATDYFNPDTADTPEDAAADRAAIEAFNRDAWHYVGTVVTASRAGVALGTAAIWGQEYGEFPGHTGSLSPLDADPDDPDNFANGYGRDLVAEAIEEAKAKLLLINNDGPCPDCGSAEH